MLYCNGRQISEAKCMQEKTNVMRILDKAKIPYSVYTYDGGALSGVEVANVLKKDERQVFKTLVTVSKTLKNYVFMIPVAEELDLKKAAFAVGEKSLSMLKSKDLLPVTGYVHGGCSPIGMKKPFPTTIDESARSLENIVFSGGKIGYQVELKVSDLQKIVPLRFADILSEHIS